MKLQLALLALMTTFAHAETLPPLEAGKAPQNFAAMWSGFDPRVEPLETEVLKEWEESGVVLRVVRFRIGVFKGQKAMMAAVYGFPKWARNRPGLVQIHGGGQYADYRAPLTNARRGYATVSIAWAGRISAPGYTVNNDVVKLFWDGKTTDPAYKLTTDWGALDAYHAPCRNEKNAFAHVNAAPWTLDAVESPRNNPWFLCALGARRALTFLEQQSEVDAQKLGVYGHSMGGKITVMTAAADERVKAAAPSCGGLSDLDSGNALYRATLNDDQQLQRITCPIIFLSPSNDFHGRINDLQSALQLIKTREWRVTCSPHHNHQDTAEYQVAGPLWFDQIFQGSFAFPQTPEAAVQLKTDDGVPRFSVTPDTARVPLSVDIFYTQQGQMPGERNDHENTMARFWHHATAQRNGNSWSAPLPLFSTDKPLWAYANVLYALEKPVSGAGYYYAEYTAQAFNLSSRTLIFSPTELRAAGVRATLTLSLLIETFAPGWQKEWFTYDLGDNWARKTHKLYAPPWQAPAGAKLTLEVRASQANRLVIGLDDSAAEIALTGGAAWQSIVLTPGDFKSASGTARTDWKGIRELRLGPQETLRKGEITKPLGAAWQGPAPEFRNLRWIAP